MPLVADGWETIWEDHWQMAHILGDKHRQN